MFNFAAEEARGHLVGFIANDEIEADIGRAEQVLNLIVAGQFVEARDHEIIFLKPIPRAGSA